MNLSLEQIEMAARAYWTSTWAAVLPPEVRWENIEEDARERARASMREAIKAIGFGIIDGQREEEAMS
jgi:hypothetical protein